MDIGSKIREARSAAGLTQEQAAEALGVSRQTMSNWENNKTYPDIVSVIRMSDLYAVTLDSLLKEKEKESSPMPNYMDYLEESTNIVKSREKLSKIILIVTYLGIWALSLLSFWLFLEPTDGALYTIVVQWFLLPVATFVISLLIGKNGFWGKKMWFATLAFGVMVMLADYATFPALNMIRNADSVFHAPKFWLLPIGAAVSAVGLGVGCLIGQRRQKGSAGERQTEN